MRNPQTHCQKCGRRYGITEESCSGCGFDPIGADAEEFDRACELYQKRNK